jgi:hypothetical protein
MKDEKPRPPPDPGAFQRFTEFARRLMSVPKTEIDERAREYERKKRERQRKRK